MLFMPVIAGTFASASVTVTGAVFWISCAPTVMRLEPTGAVDAADAGAGDHDLFGVDVVLGQSRLGQHRNCEQRNGGTARLERELQIFHGNPLMMIFALCRLGLFSSR